MGEKNVENDGGVSRTKTHFVQNSTFFFGVPPNNTELPKKSFFGSYKTPIQIDRFSVLKNNPRDRFNSKFKQGTPRQAGHTQISKNVKYTPCFFCIFLTCFCSRGTIDRFVSLPKNTETMWLKKRPI